MMAAVREERRTAICSAVFELLGEVGYDRMTMDAVAARARASKATIYRNWPNKPDLVIAALRERYGPSSLTPDTGSLRDDLMATMTAACAMACSVDGAIMAGLMTAAARDPELATVFHRYTYEMKHAVYQTIVARAVDRGELAENADSELLHETLHAMVLSRRLGGDRPLDRAFAERIVDRVLLPVLRHSG